MALTALQFDTGISRTLTEEVMDRSGQNLLACYQCRRCAAGCPVGDQTGMTPDRLIRTIVCGDRESALNNLLVWKCVACYACGSRCPNNIQTARINEALKEMGKEDHIEPLLPAVAAFHDNFMRSASHFGRINEIEFMGLYELQNTKREIKKGGGWKALAGAVKRNTGLAVSMMRKKRLHLGLNRIRNLAEIKRLYRKAGRGHGG
jgi:heterodisulfide reductase subunit C2